MTKPIQTLVDLGLKSGKLAGPMTLVTSLALVRVEDTEGLAIPTHLSDTTEDMHTMGGVRQGNRVILSLGETKENSRFLSWRDVLILDKENAKLLHEQLTGALERWK